MGRETRNRLTPATSLYLAPGLKIGGAFWKEANEMSDVSVYMRGFSCVGLYRPKTAENVGGVLRAAHCYGVSSVILDGARNRDLRHCTNTPSAHTHMPVTITGDMMQHIPFDVQLVAVDLVPGAISLPSFQHPKRAFYVFGPEDGTLGGEIVSRAQHIVYVPTRNCMNLAACVNVVLYDRMAKSLRDNGDRLPRSAP